MDEIEYLGATSTLLSYNLFTYCEGNPVNRYDPTGQVMLILLKHLVFIVLMTVLIPTICAVRDPSHPVEETKEKEEKPKKQPEVEKPKEEDNSWVIILAPMGPDPSNADNIGRVFSNNIIGGADNVLGRLKYDFR